jgi:hypothetical protein
VKWIQTPDNTRLSTAITPSTLSKNKGKNNVGHDYNVEEIKDVIISTSKIYGTIIVHLFYAQLQNYSGDRYSLAVSSICTHCYGIVLHNLALIDK